MHKLINIKTGESHLCEKVIIDGFDYYANYPEKCCIQKEGKSLMNKGCMERNHCEKFIATNKPNIDIPKVVDIVEELAYEYYSENEHYKAADAFHFKNGYNKSQETYPFSEEDVVEFGEIIAWNMVGKTITESFVKEISKELLQFWKEQKPKTIYFDPNNTPEN